MGDYGASILRALRAKRISEAVVIGIAGGMLVADAVVLMRAHPSAWVLCGFALAVVALNQIVVMQRFASEFRTHVILDDDGVRKAFPFVAAAAARSAAAAGIRTPDVCLLEDSAPHACSWMSNRGREAIGIRYSLLWHLPPRCVAAILAHEIAHIRNRDRAVASAFGMLAAAIRTGAYHSAVGMLTVIVATAVRGAESAEDIFPLILDLSLFSAANLAVLMALAVVLVPWSLRKTELAADVCGAALVRDPVSLVMGLLFLDILSGTARRREPWIVRFLSSHPPTQSRIRELLRMVERDDPNER